jgi:hypothetical protein
MTFNMPSSAVVYGFSGDIYRVLLPGITNGNCLSSGRSGYNSSNLTMYDPSNLFLVDFYDGDWQNYYEDSYLQFRLVGTIDMDRPYSILIDRSNGLRRSCLFNSSFLIEEYRPDMDTFGAVGLLDLEGYPQSVFEECYAYSSSMSFFPQMQKLPNEITMVFSFAQKLLHGDRLRVYLPGFTNAGRYLTNVEDSAITSSVAGETVLSTVWWRTSFDWTNTWTEGNFSDGYVGSYVEFSPVLDGWVPSGSVDHFPDRNNEFNLTISRTSQLSPYCGQKPNFEGFAFEVFGGQFNISRTSFGSTAGIGFGCDAQNKCNGNGDCNFCTNTCECFDGFGSAQDLAYAATDNFKPDCSSRTCPVGPAVRNAGRDMLTPTRQHRLIECSNNGKCNRLNGTCTCFKGFGGAACEKMDCPGTPTCSGRGQCLPTTVLSVREDALPLTTEAVQYRHYKNGDGRSWDANFGHSCVCDSGWEVGLLDGQTQQSEWFGPSCQYRHCPTGDDPQTVGVDETDCYLKSVTGTGELGQLGNKCHVDCSNLGICNYTSGLCSCFPGFGGSNCASRVEVESSR